MSTALDRAKAWKAAQKQKEAIAGVGAAPSTPASSTTSLPPSSASATAASRFSFDFSKPPFVSGATAQPKVEPFAGPVAQSQQQQQQPDASSLGRSPPLPGGWPTPSSLPVEEPGTSKSIDTSLASAAAMQHEQALNFEVTLNAERSAKTKALDAYFVAHKQKEELQKQVNELSKQVESAKSAGSAPLTLEMCSSAREARDVLQLGPKAVEKDIVAKYEELISTQAHLESTWKGALYTIAIEHPDSEVYSRYVRTLNEKEARAHFEAVKLPTGPHMFSGGLMGGGGGGEAFAAEKARSAKLDAKLTAMKRELEARTAEVATWKKKAEDAQDASEQQPSRKLQVLQDDLAKSTEERQTLEAEVQQLRERAEKWEEERMTLLEAKRASEAVAEKLKATGATESKRHSPTPSTAGSGGGNSHSAFVIQKLATQVKSLNEQLATKSAENADLMMRLCELED